MTLNHDQNNCTAHLDGNQSKSIYPKSTPANGKHAAKDPKKESKKAKRIHSDALDPDIIPPAAVTVEEDINSEFYPGVYIP